MCTILVVALILAVRALLKEKDARFSDQKSMADALKGLNDAARDLTLETSRSASNLVLEATRSQEALKHALERHERAVEALARNIQDLQQEQVRLGSAFENRPPTPNPRRR